MNGRQDKPVPPEWLAAYADGEMDRNAVLAPLKQQVEEWLAEHPEGLADIEEQRRLQDLLQQTAPPDPEPAVWAAARARLQDAPRELARRRSAWSWGRLASIVAVTAAGLWLASAPTALNPSREFPGEEDAPLSVATAEEIVILSIEGDSIDALVVGEAPVLGALELLQAGEMRVTHVEPNVPRDARIAVADAPALPMIWAVPDLKR
jgi:hypothetical protein